MVLGTALEALKILFLSLEESGACSKAGTKLGTQGLLSPASIEQTCLIEDPGRATNTGRSNGAIYHYRAVSTEAGYQAADDTPVLRAEKMGEPF